MPAPNGRASVIAALMVGLGCLPAAGAPPTEAERQAICVEADERYRGIFGRSPKDEPFVAILMFKDTFCPSHLTVKQGSKLRWVNVDRRTSHSVWFKEADRPESDRIFPEETIDMTADFPPGDYPYLCGPHWKSEGMIGRLTVIGR